MKKTIFKVLAIALMACMLLGVLGACGKKDEEENKPSNSQTIGTAAAVLANMVPGSGSGAAAAAAEEAAKEGINLEFSGEGGLAVSGIAQAINSAIMPVLEGYIKTGIESVECFVNENGVKVEKAASSDKEGYETLYNISVTYYNDKEEKEVTDTYKFYFNANGADIEGNKDYPFKAQIATTVGEGENKRDVVLLAFEGNAKFDSALDTTKFVFAVNLGNEGSIASASVAVYATETGSVAIEIGASAVSTVSAKINLEVGKLGENKYGANVSVNVGVKVGLVSSGEYTAAAKVSVVGQKVENNHNYAINGSIEIKTAEISAKVYSVSAAIAGTADYDKTADELKLYITGNASVKETSTAK